MGALVEQAREAAFDVWVCVRVDVKNGGRVCMQVQKTREQRSAHMLNCARLKR